MKAEPLTDREQLIILSTKMDNIIDTVTGTRADLKEMGEKIDTVERQLRDDFITKSEFEPIKRLVYGAAGIVLSSVVVALVYLVLNSPPAGVIP